MQKYFHKAVTGQTMTELTRDAYLTSIFSLGRKLHIFFALYLQFDAQDIKTKKT